MPDDPLAVWACLCYHGFLCCSSVKVASLPQLLLLQPPPWPFLPAPPSLVASLSLFLFLFLCPSLCPSCLCPWSSHGLYLGLCPGLYLVLYLASGPCPCHGFDLDLCHGDPDPGPCPCPCPSPCLCPCAASPSATVRSDRRGDAPRGGRRDRRDGHGSSVSFCGYRVTWIAVGYHPAQVLEEDLCLCPCLLWEQTCRPPSHATSRTANPEGFEPFPTSRPGF
mmetsp:Transcript_46472/g.101111  ORF Transcript_46472/g.101111 Transcript_46472/m.101111 type:complete len:222 (+) Transcript_46472:208-873(+)